MTKEEKIKKAQQIFRERTGYYPPQIAHIWKNNKIIFSSSEKDWQNFLKENKQRRNKILIRTLIFYLIAFAGFIIALTFTTYPTIKDALLSIDALAFCLTILLIYIATSISANTLSYLGKNFIVKL